MPAAESPQQEMLDDYSAIQCDECQSVIESENSRRMSFLILDQLTVPLLGCEDHLRQFTTICGYTSEQSADLLQHRPAGGIQCPSCRNGLQTAAQPLIPIQDGVVLPLACPEHQSKVMQRFFTGLQTQQQLTATLSTPTNASL